MPLKNLDEYFFEVFRGAKVPPGHVITDKIAMRCIPGIVFDWLEIFLQGNQYLIKHGSEIDTTEPNL